MKLSPFKLIVLLITVFYAAFFILNIWWDFVAEDTFLKVTLTVCVLYALLAVYYVIVHIDSDKDLKDKDYLSN